MSPLPSDEVAADFREALSDLKMNSRPEISILTIIAKENTEHAQAISRELENHIRGTRPEFKLPALYVLDSIVKNVGTPYTVYLGRNLYKTFMEAYTLVDNQVRKAMEGLLRTWMQPVPESMDSRPVFSSDVTRDIESALIRYRTVALQHQQRQAPIRSPALAAVAPAQPWRNTPTPPNNVRYQSPAGGRGPPSADPAARQYQTNPQSAYGGQQSQYGRPSSQTPNNSFAPDMHNSSTASMTQKLNSDLEGLISQAQLDWASNLTDPGKQTKLKALMDLQTILRNQQLPYEQLKQIQDQVQQLTRSAEPAPRALASGLNSFPHGAALPVASSSSSSMTLPARTVTPQSSQNLLAQLLSSTVGQQLVATQASTPSIPTPPIHTPAYPPPTAPSGQYRASGPGVDLAALLAGASAAASSISVAKPSPSPASGSTLLASLAAAGLIAPDRIATPAATATTGVVASGYQSSIKNDVQMTTASIKVPRPHLISILYDERPLQCHACPRRFPATSQGKEMKQRHLDWHYKVKTRIADGASRGLNREWYVNEVDWVAHREQDEAAPEDQQAEQKPKVKKEAEVKFVAVPTNAGLQKTICPICQEEFAPTWHNDQWVWMDALEAGGRTYHASCYGEATRDGGTAADVATPPDLKKRKAEDDLESLRGKLKKET